MPVQKIFINDFLEKAKALPLIDVRSPGEYSHAHIPNAQNLPLFTNDERKNVGTTYKQKSREEAIKIALDYFGPKMRGMVEETEAMLAVRRNIYDNTTKQKDDMHPTSNTVLIYCWRGGMRSAAVAWLLDVYGFKVYTLVGGYKAYRKWALAQFEKKYPLHIIGGCTGSGKTLLLHELVKQNKPAIDLEKLANHKGSAFGAVGNQPSQEMFENLLANSLFAIHGLLAVESSQIADSGQKATIWIEDESQRIGNLQIPPAFWRTMRSNPVFYLDIPFEQRLDYITEVYSKTEKEKLVNSIIRIQKRLGGLDTKNAINHLLEDNYKESFRILLRYYDKWYEKALHNRENLSQLLNKIPCKNVDTAENLQKLISCQALKTV